MPALSIREAVEKLIRTVERMGAGDLLDVHNEIFPKQPRSTLHAFRGLKVSSDEVQHTSCFGFSLVGLGLRSRVRRVGPSDDRLETCSAVAIAEQS
jgi:hypothetical protein